MNLEKKISRLLGENDRQASNRLNYRIVELHRQWLKFSTSTSPDDPLPPYFSYPISCMPGVESKKGISHVLCNSERYISQVL